MSIEQLRSNMIKQQIQTWDVLDTQVLDLLRQVPREEFVPKEFASLAFTDMALPLAHGQQMFTPKEEARMVQALAIRDTDHVLEIGTGSAYATALMAKLAKQVTSVDIYPDFTKTAQDKLAQHHINNVQLVTADAAQSWREKAPYNVIAVTAAMPFLSDNFKQDLIIGGRLFVIVGVFPKMTAWLITRVAQQEWTQHSLFETNTSPLVNAVQPEQFKF